MFSLKNSLYFHAFAFLTETCREKEREINKPGLSYGTNVGFCCFTKVKYFFQGRIGSLVLRWSRGSSPSAWSLADRSPSLTSLYLGEKKMDEHFRLGHWFFRNASAPLIASYRTGRRSGHWSPRRRWCCWVLGDQTTCWGYWRCCWCRGSDSCRSLPTCGTSRRWLPLRTETAQKHCQLPLLFKLSISSCKHQSLHIVLIHTYMLPCYNLTDM